MGRLLYIDNISLLLLALLPLVAESYSGTKFKSCLISLLVLGKELR